MKYYSNEIVFRGHPDKVCDQISDALLDECLRQDKNSRCGIEVMGGKGKVFVTGEVTTNAKLDVEKIAKRVLGDIGYDTDLEIVDNLGKQSVDIALGTNDEVGGAGDNGMMFGYDCKDTDKYLPTAIVFFSKNHSLKYFIILIKSSFDANIAIRRKAHLLLNNLSL